MLSAKGKYIKFASDILPQFSVKIWLGLTEMKLADLRPKCPSTYVSLVCSFSFQNLEFLKDKMPLSDLCLVSFFDKGIILAESIALGMGLATNWGFCLQAFPSLSSG